MHQLMMYVAVLVCGCIGSTIASWLLPPIGHPSTMSRCPMGKAASVNPATSRNYACLPGGAADQCPTGSKCWYTGIDYLCCPMEEDDDQVISAQPGVNTVRLALPATIGRSLPPPTATEPSQALSGQLTATEPPQAPSEQPTQVALPQRRRAFDSTSLIDPSAVHTASVRSIPTVNSLTPPSAVPLDPHMASMFDQLQHGYPYDDLFYYPPEYIHKYDEETRQYMNTATTPPQPPSVSADDQRLQYWYDFYGKRNQRN